MNQLMLIACYCILSGSAERGQYSPLSGNDNVPDTIPVTSSQKKITVMDLTAKVEEKFRTFDREREPDLVLEALEMIEKAEFDATGNAEAPEKRLDIWLTFFEAIDKRIDTAWDERKLPVKGAPIPPSHQGVVYGNGEVDPADIANPEERAAYIKALRASKEHSKQYTVQLRLKRIDERAIDDLKQLVNQKYVHLPSLKKSLAALLAGSALPQERKQRLEKIL